MSSLAKFVDWAHNATFYIQSDSNKDVIIKFISVAVSLDKTARVEDWPGAFNGCTDCKQVHASSNLEELLLHLTSKEHPRNSVSCV